MLAFYNMHTPHCITSCLQSSYSQRSAVAFPVIPPLFVTSTCSCHLSALSFIPLYILYISPFPPKKSIGTI